MAVEQLAQAHGDPFLEQLLQLRSAFGAGSLGAALTSLVTAGVDMSLLVDGTFVGAAFVAGAGAVDESVEVDCGVDGGVVVLSAGAVVVDGIGCCISCVGVVGVAGSVVVCADTKPTVPTMEAAAMAAVRVLETFIEKLLV